ncbi:hypothetical protein WG66_012442 [Moniliophthora roreri]|nr:hypothetical protein WG66_012442 [Moniliophthora roreri]
MDHAVASSSRILKSDPELEQRVSPDGQESQHNEHSDSVLLEFPTAVIEKATLDALTRAQDDLKDVRAELKSARNELADTKASLVEKKAEMEIKDKKYSRLKATVAKLKQRLHELHSGNEAESQTETESSDVNEEDEVNVPSLKTMDFNSILYRSSRLPLFEDIMNNLEGYNGPGHTFSSLRPITFMNVAQCNNTGWHRSFEERLALQYTPWKDSNRKVLVITRRLYFVTDQHAVAFAPMTQDSAEHDFALISPFQDLHDEEVEVFFNDISDTRNTAPIFYAGKFRVVRLNHLHPDGIKCEKSWKIPLGGLVCAVTSSQARGPPLRSTDIKSFLKNGDIKLEFIGLQCIGFDEDLYSSVIMPYEEPAKGAKRNKNGDGDAEENRQSKKRRMG